MVSGPAGAVEAAAGKADTLCADRFTAADISVGYALRLAENIGLAKDFGPNVAAYWQRLQARDGFQRAVRRKISPASSRKCRSERDDCSVDCEEEAREANSHQGAT